MITRDYSNNSDEVIVLEFEDVRYIFRANKDEESCIADIIESEIGSELCSSSTNIPEYIEASSWCSLACLGDTYEAEYFTITVTTREDLE